MKKSISKADFYAIVGLGEVAKRKYEEVQQIELAICKLVGASLSEVEEISPIVDFVYQNTKMDAEELIESLRIKVNE